ncbi:PLAC8-domain-containing protein [Rhizophagus clarus]|uniref:PLAC8-domain-containing protein n=1 Tax=Rhizophagus clarus TaxID=94130 RepID=A0A8H3LH04_9GLOM|nr:PLAC8-domain-containing protein [Rhizophagus clarus]
MVVLFRMILCLQIIIKIVKNFKKKQGYNSQQQGGYVQQQQLQQQQLLLQQQQQQQQRPPLPQQQQQQQQQPLQQQQSQQYNEWNFGLFDCFADLGLCLKTTFCPCITYGENRGRLNGNPNPDTCSQDAFIYCCVQYCFGASCILGAMHRNEIRAKYNIEGNGICDFCTHFCFGCCALIQESREITANPLP